MLKKTFPVFLAAALIHAFCGVLAQAAVWSLSYPANQVVFPLYGLAGLGLMAWVLFQVAALRVSLPPDRKTRFLQVWLPLSAGLLLWMLGDQIISNLIVPIDFLGRYSLDPLSMLPSIFCGNIWRVAGIWLLLVLLGRLFWKLPFPRLSLRTVGRLCLAVLAGTLLSLPLLWLSLGLTYAPYFEQSDTLLNFCYFLDGAGVFDSFQTLLSALQTLIGFTLIYGAAFIWAGSEPAQS